MERLIGSLLIALFVLAACSESGSDFVASSKMKLCDLLHRPTVERTTLKDMRGSARYMDAEGDYGQYFVVDAKGDLYIVEQTGKDTVAKNLKLHGFDLVKKTDNLKGFDAVFMTQFKDYVARKEAHYAVFNSRGKLIDHSPHWIKKESRGPAADSNVSVDRKVFTAFVEKHKDYLEALRTFRNPGRGGMTRRPFLSDFGTPYTRLSDAERHLLKFAELFVGCDLAFREDGIYVEFK